MQLTPSALSWCVFQMLLWASAQLIAVVRRVLEAKCYYRSSRQVTLSMFELAQKYEESKEQWQYINQVPVAVVHIVLP